MNPTSFDPDSLLPRNNVLDPRMGVAFCPDYWPLCNGKALPAYSSDPFDLRCLELLAAYYQLNLARKRIAEGSGSVENLAVATEALATIEDRYSPIGFFGEPVWEGGFVRDIRVVRPGLEGLLSKAASLSSQFAIPGLEQIPEAELLGEAKIRRWSHGKMDS